jgi:death-on-curing protein
MSKSIKWVSLPVVLAIHDELMVQFGGSPGIRDQGLLLSALSRPEQSAHYEKPDIANLAATYAVAITNNLSFADGNKRTGFAVAVTFLELNGFYLTLPEAEAVILMLGIATGQINEAGAAEVFHAHSKSEAPV